MAERPQPVACNVHAIVQRNEERRRQVREALSAAELSRTDESQVLDSLGLAPSQAYALETAQNGVVQHRGPSADENLTTQEFWKKIFQAERLTLEDLLPARAFAAWRFVREFLRVQSVLRPDDSLTESVPFDPACDYWTVLRPYVPRGLAPHPALRAALEQAAALDPPGLPILPPPPPPEQIGEDGEPLAGYRPGTDARLLAYMDAFEAITRYLHLDTSSPLGLRGLASPSLFRLLFPSRAQILATEEYLVGQALDLLVLRGVNDARRQLLETYSLEAHEVLGLIKMANQEATRRTEASLEENKAIMVLRLEEIIRQSFDPRAKMAALKQLAIVHGFGRMEPEDAAHEFAAVVRRVTAESARPHQGSVIDGRKLTG